MRLFYQNIKFLKPLLLGIQFMTELNESNASESKNGSDQTRCPLQMIPASAWAEFMKNAFPKPFRKRHPFIFWPIVIIIIIGICAALFSSSSSKDTGLNVDDDSLALIKVRGPIIDTTETREWIRKIEHCDKIKGVLLRVDSPGGGAAASQELYADLKRLAQKKPIVVSMGQVAASGGLMISMAGKHIFANSSTITGSIGVRMDIPQVKELMNKIGLNQETLVTGPYKDAGSYMRPLSSEEKEYFQGILRDMHTQFVEIIADGRKMSVEDVQKIATGRIFTGREAIKLGLIDEIGGQEDAHIWLAKATNIPIKKKLVTKPKNDKWYHELIKSLCDFDLTSLTNTIDLLKQNNHNQAFLYQY